LPTRLRKVRKQRGSRFHGWGQIGQHRKNGGKGGVGQAGLLKHKWTWTVKYDPDHFGKKGFVSPTRKVIKRWINVGQLDSLASSLNNGKAKKPILNLTDMGYEKLLGQGQVKGAYQIKVALFSESAKNKIEKTGGSIVVEE
jgi:large subunit ribosomal protein L15